MSYKLKIATVVAVAATLSACAADDLQIWKRNGNGSPDFQRLLLKGKAPAGMSLTSPRGFSLSNDSSIVTSEVDPGDGRVSFISYDTNRMSDVPRSSLKAAALAHVSTNSESFGVPADELRETENAEVVDGNGNVTLSFQRFVEDILVDSSLFQVTFAPMGNDVYRIRQVVNHTYGDIKLSANEKMTVADSRLTAAMGLSRMVELDSSTVIFPHINDKGVYEHALATRLTLEDPENGERFTVTTKSDGELLEAVSNRTHAVHQLLVELWERTPSSAKRVQVPLGYVTVQGVTTDKDGKADFTVGQNLAIPLSGVTVSRATITGATITVPTVAATDKSLYAMNATTAPAVNAYAKVNIVADFVKQHLPNNAFITRQVTTIVNINDICNAFYDPSAVSLNFFRRSVANDATQCENSALIDDVVYHEWGHGLDDFTGPTRGITDGAYSEGIGDILSMLLTGSNNLAPGFLLAQPTTGLRNLENTKKYPGDLVNEVHDDGEIIGATFWDMRKALVARYGAKDGALRTEKMFLNSLATTTRYLDSYQQILLLDDNDNNPATKSPNYCLITAAFAGHGLATAEPNCIDAVTANDDSLKLAIRSMTGASTVTLYGSSDSQSAKIGVCVGEREACVAAKRIDAEFTDLRTTTDGIKIYQSAKVLELTDGMIVTILSFGADGTVRGARSAKFTKEASQL